MPQKTKPYPLLVDQQAVAGLKPSLKKGAKPMVDIDKLAEDLTNIKRALVRVFEKADTRRSFALESLEIGLTFGAEGRVAFIAKASVEASITLTFTRNQ